MKNCIGIDIGGTKMYMVAEVDGEYIERKVSTGIHCTKAFIKEEIEDFINTLPFQVGAIGVALPGLISNEDTLECSDVVPHLNGMTTAYLSEGRFKMKFLNDVKAATLCEVAHYPEADTVAVIMVGTGIALGVAVKGETLQGAAGFSGEMGNAYIPYEGGIEKFDNLSGGAAILKKANCTAEELLERLEKGDTIAQEIIDEAAYYFGLGLGLIIQFYNPDVIVVGGSTSTYTNYMEVAKKVAQKYTLPELFECCRIEPPKDRRRIVALGAIEFMK